MNNSTVFGVFAPINMTSDDGGADHKVVNVAVVVMLSIFSVVGVIGNALAFYIFFRRRATSTSVIFILALAGTDFITCLVTIPYTVVMELLSYNLVYDFACKTYMFLITSTVPFSAYIMVAIALDRYFCICHPFLHAFTIPRAKAVILCMGIPAIAFGTITGLSHGTYIFEYLEPILSNVSEPLPQAELDQLYSGRPDQEKQLLLSINSTVDPIIRHYNICVSNNFYFSDGFYEVYKRVHALNFLVAYVSVAILYILIYKSIFTRRANKARRKKNNLYPATGAKIKGQPPEETQMTVIQNADHASPKLMNNQTRKDAKCARKITLTARNDPAAFVKTTGKITPGPPSVIPEVQEDERTNLLSGSDEAGNNETNENANNTSNTTTTTTDEPKNVYDADGKEQEANTSPKNVSADGSKLGNEPKANGVLKSVSSPSEKQMINENGSIKTTTKLDTFTNNNVTEDDGPSVCVFSNGTAPEEKPLLSPPAVPLQQMPPTPPTSLSLKPSVGHVTSSQSDAKNSVMSKKYCLGKHVSTDAHTNSIKRKRPSTVRDRNLMANIKTAFMLFIVTLVFIIAFLPALLMANNLIPLNLIVFYSYFIYNVANPFIYAFMNQTFREDLKKIISVCRRSNDN